jgi:hypothetical protein
MSDVGPIFHQPLFKKGCCTICDGAFTIWRGIVTVLKGLLILLASLVVNAGLLFIIVYNVFFAIVFFVLIGPLYKLCQYLHRSNRLEPSVSNDNILRL